MKQYTNFQNVTKFVSQHLDATHGHFHRHQFLTANYFFIRPDLSYLAVTTATWQHCAAVEVTADADWEDQYCNACEGKVLEITKEPGLSLICLNDGEPAEEGDKYKVHICKFLLFVFQN
jgi:hypothetical protein